MSTVIINTPSGLLEAVLNGSLLPTLVHNYFKKETAWWSYSPKNISHSQLQYLCWERMATIKQIPSTKEQHEEVVLPHKQGHSPLRCQWFVAWWHWSVLDPPQTLQHLVWSLQLVVLCGQSFVPRNVFQTLKKVYWQLARH